MELSVKTKMIGSFDMNTVDIDSMIPDYQVDEKLLNRDIERILKANGTRTEVDEVQAGDTVVLSCISKNSKFNKDNITVIVGKGLYSKELENALIGRKVGEEHIYRINDFSVMATVKKCERIILPELTDENVAAFGNDEYSSVRELKKYCIDKQIAKYLDDCEELEMAQSQFWMSIGNAVTFEYDDEEYAFMLKNAEKRFSEIENNIQNGEIEPVEDSGEDESASADDMNMEEFFKKIYITNLRMAAYGYSLYAGTDKEITTDSYNEFIRKWSFYYDTMTEDEIKEKHPLMEYVLDYYSELGCNEVDDFAIKYFKKKMNPLA